MKAKEERFYTIEVNGKRYVVKATSEEDAKELLTHSLWIRRGEEQARVERIFGAIEAELRLRIGAYSNFWDWWRALKKQEGID